MSYQNQVQQFRNASKRILAATPPCCPNCGSTESFEVQMKPVSRFTIFYTEDGAEISDNAVVDFTDSSQVWVFCDECKQEIELDISSSDAVTIFNMLEVL